MPEEIKIKVAVEGAAQAKHELLGVEKAKRAAAGADGGPRFAPGATVPGGRPDAGLTQSATEAMRGPDTRAAAAARIRASYAAEREETDRLTDQAQERLNDQLVKEEAKRQGHEAKAAVAAERKTKADGLRAGRTEQSRSWTEERMQERLNEQLVREEEKRQKQEEQRKREETGQQHRRAQAEGRVEVMELRGAGKEKEAETLERTLNIHSRAVELQKSLNLHRDAAVKLATREVDAQAELNKKSGVGGAVGVGRSAIGLVDGATGGSPFGGVLSSLGAMGGPAGIAAAAVAATTIGMAAAFASQARTQAVMQLADTADRAVRDRSLERASSFEGSAGASRSSAEASKDDYIKRTADRARLQKEAEVKWWSPRSWVDHITGADQNDIAANDMVRVQDLKDEAKQRVTQKAKWQQENKPLLDAARLRAQGDMRGSRDKQYEADWLKTYNEAQSQGATEGDAREMADLHTADQKREEGRKWGRIINARSGAGDIARVAALASGEIRGHGGGGGHPVVSALDTLIKQAAEHHAEGMGHVTARDLKPRSLRERH